MVFTVGCRSTSAFILEGVPNSSSPDAAVNSTRALQTSCTIADIVVVQPRPAPGESTMPFANKALSTQERWWIASISRSQQRGRRKYGRSGPTCTPTRFALDQRVKVATKVDTGCYLGRGRRHIRFRLPQQIDAVGCSRISCGLSPTPATVVTSFHVPPIDRDNFPPASDMYVYATSDTTRGIEYHTDAGNQPDVGFRRILRAVMAFFMTQNAPERHSATRSRSDDLPKGLQIISR